MPLISRYSLLLSCSINRSPPISVNFCVIIKQRARFSERNTFYMNCVCVCVHVCVSSDSGVVTWERRDTTGLFSRFS